MTIHDMPGHLIRRLQQMSGQVFAAHARQQEVELTSVQFAALDAIRANPGIDQAGVAAQIAYDRATIGGVIDRLETKGLILRRVSATDRRAREITLTPRGEAVYAAYLPVVKQVQDDILAGLDDRERASFLALARKAVDARGG